MDKKERIRVLAELLDENFYFKPNESEGLRNEYAISENGKEMRIYSATEKEVIHGVDNFINKIIALGLHFYIEYSLYDKRVQITVF